MMSLSFDVNWLFIVKRNVIRYLQSIARLSLQEWTNCACYCNMDGHKHGPAVNGSVHKCHDFSFFFFFFFFFFGRSSNASGYDCVSFAFLSI